MCLRKRRLTGIGCRDKRSKQKEGQPRVQGSKSQTSVRAKESERAKAQHTKEHAKQPRRRAPKGNVEKTRDESGASQGCRTEGTESGKSGCACRQFKLSPSPTWGTPPRLSQRGKLATGTTETLFPLPFPLPLSCRSVTLFARYVAFQASPSPHRTSEISRTPRRQQITRGEAVIWRCFPSGLSLDVSSCLLSELCL